MVPCRVLSQDVDDEVGIDEVHGPGGSGFVGCGAAHRGDNLVGGHPGVTLAAQAFDAFLAACGAVGGLGGFHQVEVAGLDWELTSVPGMRPARSRMMTPGGGCPARV